MTKFAVGQPVTTDTPSVTVDALPAGQYVFSLVVVDSDGRRSEPATAVVVVAKPRIG